MLPNAPSVLRTAVYRLTNVWLAPSGLVISQVINNNARDQLSIVRRVKMSEYIPDESSFSKSLKDSVIVISGKLLQGIYP